MNQAKSNLSALELESRIRIEALEIESSARLTALEEESLTRLETQATTSRARESEASKKYLDEISTLKQENLVISASLEFLKSAEYTDCDTQTDPGYEKEVESMRHHVVALEKTNDELSSRNLENTKVIETATAEIKAFEEVCHSRGLDCI